MEAENSYNVEVLANKIDNFESQLIKVRKEFNRENEVIKAEDRVNLAILLFCLPVALSFLILMGLDINFKTEKHSISYSNSNLVELGLSALTLASGFYSIKKYRDKEPRVRD